MKDIPILIPYPFVFLKLHFNRWAIGTKLGYFHISHNSNTTSFNIKYLLFIPSLSYKIYERGHIKIFTEGAYEYKKLTAKIFSDTDAFYLNRKVNTFNLGIYSLIKF